MVKINWRNDKVYDIKKLWKLTNDLRIYNIPISELKWVLYEDFWSNYEGIKNPNFPEKYISAMEVLENPSISKFHQNKINDADLNYPILVIVLDNTKFDVIDGIHRLTKAYIKNMKYIKAKIVPFDILEESIIEGN